MVGGRLGWLLAIGPWSSWMAVLGRGCSRDPEHVRRNRPNHGALCCMQGRIFLLHGYTQRAIPLDSTNVCLLKA